jgi:hypothetical protein
VYFSPGKEYRELQREDGVVDLTILHAIDFQNLGILTFYAESFP